MFGNLKICVICYYVVFIFIGYAYANEGNESCIKEVLSDIVNGDCGNMADKLNKKLSQDTKMSGDQFWQKILILLRDGGGYVDPEMFRQKFGISLNQYRHSDVDDAYVLDKNDDFGAYVRLDVKNEKFHMPPGFGENGAGSVFTIGWNDTSKNLHDKPDNDWRIEIEQSLRDLIGMGWKVVVTAEESAERLPPYYVELKRDDGNARLDLYWSYCGNIKCLYRLISNAQK